MKHCKLTIRDKLTPLPDSVTLCATVDELGHEQIVTDVMIRRACEQIDSDQLWPVSAKALQHHTVCASTSTDKSAVILSFTR